MPTLKSISCIRLKISCDARKRTRILGNFESSLMVQRLTHLVGGRYWINQKEIAAVFTYPYLEELREEVRKFKEEYRGSKADPFLKDFSPFQVIVSNPTMISKLNEFRSEILKTMEEYFHIQPSANHELMLRNRMIDIKDRVQEIVSLNMDMADFINLMFFCDFDIEKYLME